MLPDLDSIGFYFGIPYGSLFGHRGITYFLVFAALFGGGSRFILKTKFFSKNSFYLFLAMTSHAALDALTNGGLGVFLVSEGG